MEQTNLLSVTQTLTTATDSGLDGCSTNSIGNTSSSVFNDGGGNLHQNHHNNHDNMVKNSETTSAIDLSEMNLQEDIPHDDHDNSDLLLSHDESSQICELPPVQPGTNDAIASGANIANASVTTANKRISQNRLSSDSGSTFELIDYNSPNEMTTSSSMMDDWNGKTEMPIMESSASERDTFSPVNSEENVSCHLINETTLKVGDCNFTIADQSLQMNQADNNLLRRHKHDMHFQRSSTTKEEKQRQNEEIVILESSSISSETGSWEALFPNNYVEVKESCKTFLVKERTHCDNLTTSNCNRIVNNCNVELRRNLDDYSPPECPQSSRVASACFIDASSLLDDDEVSSIPYIKNNSNNNNSNGPTFPEIGCFTNRLPESGAPITHRDIAQCSSKTESSQNSPKLDETQINKENSEPEDDLEKHLWSSNEEEEAIEYHARQASCQSETPKQAMDNVKQRQEYEKMQGEFLFKNNIKQFSGHLISPKMPFPSSTAPAVLEPNGISMGEEATTLIYPDTPHNSIITVSSMTLERKKNPLHSEDPFSTTPPPISAVTAPISNQSTPPIQPEEIGYRIPKRTQKCDESAPIVSGGASIKDFSPKLCESPPVRRKAENCPIVSGGSIFMHLTEESRSHPIIPQYKSSEKSLSSWVVDMSGCTNRRPSESSSSSSNEPINQHHSLERCSSSTSKNGSLGYFVDFDNLDEAIVIDDNDKKKDESNLSSLTNDTPRKKGTGFFIDLSDTEQQFNSMSSTVSSTRTPPVTANPHTKDDKVEENNKKNLFSMFIDFGSEDGSDSSIRRSKPINRREPFSLSSKLSTSLNYKKTSPKSNSSNDLMSKSISTVESSEVSSDNECVSSGFNSLTKIDETKRLDDNQPPPNSINNSSSAVGGFGGVVYRRATNLTSFSKDFKRHSWNTNNGTSNQTDIEKLENENNKNSTNREYKRSQSLSTDKSIMSILDKIPLISKTSSMSIDSSISPYDDVSGTKSDISICSYNSNNDKMKKHRRDAKINETFDKSSQGSITDGIFSKDSSPMSTTTETDDVTFQNEVIPSNNKSAVIGGGSTVIVDSDHDASVNSHSVTIQQSAINQHTMETLQATIEKQKKLLETVSEIVEVNPSTNEGQQNSITTSQFVKLSDMDKPMTPVKFELHATSEIMTTSAGSRVAKLFQDSKTANAKDKRVSSNAWNMSRSTGNNIANLATSFENSRSLSRLFPHLSKVFSNSLPSDVGYNSIDKNINELNEYYTVDEMSNTSSIASSRSGFESVDESSISCRQPRRLGEDLLKMFLQEIATDVTIEVGNKKMRAHKCILRSRCQYFAAILAGGWVQSAGNIISLPGYSYDVVHFALCHIYSGAAHPPEGISLMELAALADLLGLEGLKEVTAYALRTNYCHNFHKPCSGCIDGIVQVLPVSLNHGLDDLYRKCLKWVCRHYVKVWPTRCFAQLNFDLVCRCRQQIGAHINSENVLNMCIECENLLAQLAPCKWAANVDHVVRELIEMSHNYISDHFASLIASDSFLSLGHGNSWNTSRLEHLLLRTAATLTPDQACKSYQRVTRLNTVLGAKVITVPLQNGGLSSLEHSQQEEMEWSDEFVRLVSAILSAVEQCLTRQCARAMKVNAWQRMDVELRKKIQQLACLSGPVERKSRELNKMNLNYNQSMMRRYQDFDRIRSVLRTHNNQRSMSNDRRQYKATSAYTQTNNVDRIVQPQSNLTDKSVQANRESNGTSVTVKPAIPLSKTASRTQVPEISVVKPKPTANIQTHKRSQSETIKIVKDKSMSNLPKLTNIKPRYLEPKKPTVPVRQNGKIVAKGNRMSSSESSTRASSPASKNALSNKKIHDSNISLDSLSSPAKAAKVLKALNPPKNADPNEYSGDSLGESCKSLSKTDKTISHECLVSNKPLQSKNLSKSNPVIMNKENKLMKNASTTAVPSQLKAKNNDVLNKRRASSLTKQIINENTSSQSSSSSSIPKRSFFTAKSREILSKKQQQQTTTTTNTITATQQKPQQKSLPVTKSSSASPVLLEKPKFAINKSSSSSNVPFNSNRRSLGNNTTNFQTTNMTAVAAATVKDNKAKLTKNLNNKNKTTTNQQQHQHNININKVDEEIIVEFVMPSKLSRGSMDNDDDLDEIHHPHRYESKLERSSTFCKESSDIPSSELQIIE